MAELTLRQAQEQANQTGKTLKWGNQIVQPQATGLMGVVKSIAKPFGQVAESGAFLTHGLAELSRAQKGEKMLGEYVPTFTDYETSRALTAGGEKGTGQFDLGQTLKESSKAAAGVGSYLTPMGAGFGGAVKGGALAGLLSGYGASETGKGLESALTGAGTGAVTGGALYGAGKLFEKLSKAKLPGAEKATTKAEGMQYATFKTPTTATKGGINTAEKRAVFDKKLTNIAKDFGIKETGSVEQNLIQLDNAKKTALESAAKLRAESATPIDMTDIMTGKTFKSNPKVVQSKAVGEVVDAYNNTLAGKPNVTAEEAYRFLKDNVDTKINYAKTPGSGVTSTETNALKDIEQSIRAKINNAVGGNYKYYNNVYSTIEDFQKMGGDARLLQAATGTRPVISKEGLVEKALVQGSQKAKPAVSKLLEGYGKATLPDMTKISGALQNKILRQLAPSAVQKLTAQQAQQTQQMPQNLQAMPEMTGGQGVAKMGATDYLAQAQAMLPNGKQSEILALAKYLQSSSGEKPMTETQKKFNVAADIADQAYNMLASGKGRTGKIGQIQSGVEEFFGTQPQDVTDYRSKVASARMAAVNALSGAAVSPSEAERMYNMIPQDSDEYNVALQKLKSFSEAMRMYSGGSRIGTTQDNLNSGM